MSRRNIVYGMLLIFALLVSVVPGVFAAPTGGTITEVNSTSAPEDTPTSDAALAGNVTTLTVTGTSTTQSWQGYVGNVTGTIQLADSSDRVLYNWSLASPEGEIYASTNSSIVWTNVSCFNFTAQGTYADDSAQAGATSFFGTNMTQLEDRFNISATDADGVNETFTLTGAGTHDAFFTGSLSFAEGECQSTRVFDSTGAGVANNFEEALLYGATTDSIIFVSILDEDQAGFNDAEYDFEMLVLEDGHSGDVSTTTYYFYVELE